MINNYRTINNSFKKKLVYHLGSEAGFFSEYNNMVLAMLYCLEHKIKFELYSKDSNFGYLKGWQDYFAPFCDETVDERHSKYNHRQPLKLSFAKQIETSIFKLFTGINYLTYDLWNRFHDKEFENVCFKSKILTNSEKILDNCSRLIELTWKYNKETQLKIEELIGLLELPKSYIGMHIRGGDKFIEYDKVEIEKYFEIAKRVSDLNDIFVLTDDYHVIIEMKKLYPDYNFFTLCNVDERGYYHNDFTGSDDGFKKKRLLRLFASVDVLSLSDCFIGTFSSNPGMYLGMRMPIEKVYGVDLDKWTIW